MFTKADIEKYFMGEKAESRLFMALGAAGMITALLFFFVMKHDFYRGASVPLFAVGLILATVGYTVYRRSDEDRKRNVYAYDMNPAELKEKELPRMRTVMRNFVIYRWVELVLLLAGAATYIYFIRDFKHDFWRGLGLGLAGMALVALVADYFAEKRGRTYTRGLASFVS